MKALTVQNVETIFLDCLFREGEDTTQAKIVEGVLGNFGFNPERLEIHKAEIAELLGELPDEFHADKGGGWSFLNACMTKNGDQWGEHRNIEQLLTLGIATEQAQMSMPREVWSILPGGMPYFTITTQPTQKGPNQMTPIMDDEDAVRADYEKLKELLEHMHTIADTILTGPAPGPECNRTAWRVMRGNIKLALDLIEP